MNDHVKESKYNINNYSEGHKTLRNEYFFIFVNNIKIDLLGFNKSNVTIIVLMILMIIRDIVNFYKSIFIHD